MCWPVPAGLIRYPAVRSALKNAVISFSPSHSICVTSLSSLSAVARWWYTAALSASVVQFCIRDIITWSSGVSTEMRYMGSSGISCIWSSSFALSVDRTKSFIVVGMLMMVFASSRLFYQLERIGGAGVSSLRRRASLHVTYILIYLFLLSCYGCAWHSMIHPYCLHLYNIILLLSGM